MRILEILYRAYLILINAIAVFSSKLTPRMRAGIMEMSIFGVLFLGVIAYSGREIKDLLHYDEWGLIVSVVMLLLLLIASIDRKIIPVKIKGIRPLFWVGWYLCFVLMSVSAIFHYVWNTYCLYAMLSISIFPILMIIWNERGDFNRLCLLLARNMVLASYIFLLLNILITAFITNEGLAELGYRGLTDNQNSNGLIVLPFFTSALYLLITDRKYSRYYLFSLAISIMFIVISKTRTAGLAIILEVLIASMICIRHRAIFRRKTNIRKMLTALLAAAVLSSVIGCGLLFLDRVNINAYAVNEIEEASAEVNSSENLIKLNRLTNGRLILWKAYLKKVGFIGHGNPDGPLFEWYDYSKWAHNNALDIWYASGFLAFLGYVLWLLAAWGFVIRSIFISKDFRKVYLLSAISFVGYFTEAMLEITIYPMYTGIAFLSFLTMVPIAFKENRGEV